MPEEPRRPARVRRLLLGLLAAILLSAALVVLLRRGREATQTVAPPSASSVAPELRHEVSVARARPNAPAFPSAERPGAPAVIWAVGDGANGSDDARRLARTIAADRPQRVLYLGDVYETGTASDFRKHFADVYGGLVPVMVPTPGNHDWPKHAAGYDPYWERATGRPTPHWYALSIGGWRIVSLNSETPDDPAQLRFLDDELARPGGGRCLMAFLHRSRESAGRHGDNADVEPLWQRLRGRATVVLAGHDHDLQRLRPVDGTTEFVIGAGGRERYGIDKSDPRLRFANDDVDGALRLALRPGAADLAITATGGRVLDRSSVRCR